MENQKIECEKSPTGKHQWKTVEDEPDTLTGKPINWAIVPGDYCVYCDQRKK